MLLEKQDQDSGDIVLWQGFGSLYSNSQWKTVSVIIYQTWDYGGHIRLFIETEEGILDNIRDFFIHIHDLKFYRIVHSAMHSVYKSKKGYAINLGGLPKIFGSGLNIEFTSTTMDVGDKEDLTMSYAEFYSINFPHVFNNDFETDDEGNSVLYHRGFELLADDWHITFRTDREYYGGSSGMPDNGYVVTHIGRVTKRDGEVFRPFEAQKILGIVRSWFTILRGAWVTALPVGFNSEGVKVWIDFKQERVQKLLRHEEILIDYNFETWSSMFLRFRDLYSEDDYRSTIETAVDWYVEARKPDRPPTSAIIHVHLALEVLSWSILVKHSGMVSADGYSNMPSYDRIRLLLFWVGIKNDVPSSLYNLIEYLKDEAKSSGHSGKLKEGKTKKGGAEIISETRNRIMHPNGRGDPRNLDVSVAYSIIALGLWYIELTFLKLLDYEGKYYNRLPPEEIDPEGDPIYKDVPWVKN